MRTEDCESGWTTPKVDVAWVDNEGGILVWEPSVELDGSEGSSLPTPRVEFPTVWVPEVSSASITASKCGWRPVVNIDSGTGTKSSAG